MEVSAIQSSQSKLFPTESARRELWFCGSKSRGVRALNRRSDHLRFAPNRKWNNSRLRFASPVSVRSGFVRANGDLGFGESSESSDRVKLFVGLPLDVVSSCNSVNHERPIMAGLKVLKLLGVEGVEVPVWWGLVEREYMGKYKWSGYLSLAEMVQNAGLKLHVSLCFHGSEQSNISIPDWVSRIGESDPSIFFTDRSGQSYKECLSLGVDDLPVLGGKTPIQVYRDFCESFKSSFLSRFGSTISGISIGLGPEGELRYPSHHKAPKLSKNPGAGEFQCYDKHMLESLRRRAEERGNPLWGLGGPHDTPRYDQAPTSAGFFSDLGGSWESPYGDFFLSWYSDQLMGHGDRVLAAASSALAGLEISAQVPLAHAWHGMRAHPSELASGYYNTCRRDGYEHVAEMFAKNSAKMVLPGMDLSDECPEILVRQIQTACKKHGVGVSGQNSSSSESGGGFRRIEKHLLSEKTANSFTYNRMGVQFFSPEHFSSFTRFVKVLNQPKLYDPLEGEDFERLSMVSGSRMNMQAV